MGRSCPLQLVIKRLAASCGRGTRTMCTLPGGIYLQKIQCDRLTQSSVAGGRTVYTEVGQSQKFMDASLELGGNDAAIVLGDVDVKDTAANVVDGAMYNAGQSCCAVERALVHQVSFINYSS